MHLYSIITWVICQALEKVIILTLPFFFAESDYDNFKWMINVARVAVFLASDDANWMTGTTILVDGGAMSLNRFLEQFVVFYFRVSDLQRALEFYERQLGLKIFYVNNEIGWAELSFGSHQRPHLGLNRYSGEGDVPTNAGGTPSFQVQNMKSLKAEVERPGIPHQGIVEYSDYFHFLWILDPNGNKIEFIKLVQDRLP